MQMLFDCCAVNRLLAAWEKGSGDFSQVLCHPDFLILYRHALDFQQSSFSMEEYLHRLLHIENMDMQQRRAEIIRNLNCIREIDLSTICEDVAGFLPEEIVRKIDTIRVVPFVGAGGLAAENVIFIDPSPCPWFPNDGSQKAVYIDEFICPTLRHELHHIGYSCIRISPPVSEIKSLRELAKDFALQLQMEGGAMLCQEKKDSVSCAQMQQFYRALEWCKQTIDSWNNSESQSVDERSMRTYFSLWENDKPVYWLGQQLCSILIQHGIVKNVGDCMMLDPLSMIEMACTIVDVQESFHNTGCC